MEGRSKLVASPARFLHLRKVFSKLGVASRIELVQMGVPEPERLIVSVAAD